jgi:hypothetical protein
MDLLLNMALASLFFTVLVVFAVAIALAPAVPNERAPATEHDHEERVHRRERRMPPA